MKKHAVDHYLHLRAHATAALPLFCPVARPHYAPQSGVGPRRTQCSRHNEHNIHHSPCVHVQSRVVVSELHVAVVRRLAAIAVERHLDAYAIRGAWQARRAAAAIVSIRMQVLLCVVVLLLGFMRLQ